MVKRYLDEVVGTFELVPKELEEVLVTVNAEESREYQYKLEDFDIVWNVPESDLKICRYCGVTLHDKVMSCPYCLNSLRGG